MKAGRTIAVTVVIVCALALINWVRRDAGDWPLSHVVPFLGGHRPGLFDLAGLVLVAVFINGLMQMMSPSRRREEPDYEENEPETAPEEDDSEDDDDDEEDEDED